MVVHACNPSTRGGREGQVVAKYATINLPNNLNKQLHRETL